MLDGVKKLFPFAKHETPTTTEDKTGDLAHSKKRKRDSIEKNSTVIVNHQNNNHNTPNPIINHTTHQNNQQNGLVSHSDSNEEDEPEAKRLRTSPFFDLYVITPVKVIYDKFAYYIKSIASTPVTDTENSPAMVEEQFTQESPILSESKLSNKKIPSRSQSPPNIIEIPSDEEGEKQPHTPIKAKKPQSQMHEIDALIDGSTNSLQRSNGYVQPIHGSPEISEIKRKKKYYCWY